MATGRGKSKPFMPDSDHAQFLIGTDELYQPLRHPTPPGISDRAKAERSLLKSRLRQEVRRSEQKQLEADNPNVGAQTVQERNESLQSLRSRFVPGLPLLAAQMRGDEEVKHIGRHADDTGGRRDLSANPQDTSRRHISRDHTHAAQRVLAHGDGQALTSRGADHPSSIYSNPIHNPLPLRPSSRITEITNWGEQSPTPESLRNAREEAPNANIVSNPDVVGPWTTLLESNEEPMLFEEPGIIYEEPDSIYEEPDNTYEELDSISQTSTEESIPDYSNITAEELLQALIDFDCSKHRKSRKTKAPTQDNQHKHQQPIKSIESTTLGISNQEESGSIFKTFRGPTQKSSSQVRVGPQTSTSGIIKRYRTPNMAGGFSMQSLKHKHPNGRSHTSAPRAGYGPLPGPMTMMSERAASKLIPTALQPQTEPQPESPQSVHRSPSIDQPMLDDAVGANDPDLAEEHSQQQEQQEEDSNADLDLPFPAPLVDIDDILWYLKLPDFIKHVQSQLPGHISALRIWHSAMPSNIAGFGIICNWIGGLLDADYDDIIFMHREELEKAVNEITGEVHQQLCDSYHDYYEKRMYGLLTHTAYGRLKSDYDTALFRIADLENRCRLQEEALTRQHANFNNQDISDNPVVYTPLPAELRQHIPPEGIVTPAVLTEENLRDLEEQLLQFPVPPQGGFGHSAGLIYSPQHPAFQVDDDMEILGSDCDAETDPEYNENTNLRGGQGGIYFDDLDNEDDEVDEDETEVRPNYSVPAQWATYTAQGQDRTSLQSASGSEISYRSYSRSVFDGAPPKFDAYAVNRTHDEYTLAIHRPDNIAQTSEHVSTTSESRGRRHTYGEYSQEQESESGRSTARARSIIDPAGPENTPLAATFRTSSVTSMDTASTGDSTPLAAPNTRFATPSTNLAALDPRMEDVSLDIDEGVRANFLPITELSTAHDPNEKSNPRNSLNNAATIINVFSRDSVSTYTPKVDARVKDLDRHGKRIGNVEQQGQVKKRYLERHLELVQKRDEQMLRATAEKRAWEAMDPVERAERLAILRQPVTLWHGKPGAAPEDNFDLEEIPRVYTQSVTTKEIETWMGRIEIAEDDDNSNSHFIDNSSVYDFHTPVGSDRTSEQINRLASNLFAVNINNRAPGRRHCTYTKTSDRQHTTIASSTVETDLTLLDDSVIVGDIEDTEIKINSSLINKELLDKVSRFCSITLSHGRLVAVRLHPLVHYTPSAITKRIFGGIIQDIQFYEVKRVAVVVFLHAAEAEAFVHHVKKVKSTGTAQEARALQIDADWYHGSQAESIHAPQPNVVKNHFSLRATRVLILHNIPLTKKKEEVNAELGVRLDQLLVSVALITPPQRYVQRAKGKTAIIEFTSIKDAIEARQAIIDGQVEDYADAKPEYAADPASNPDALRAYCKCKGCEARRRLKD